MKILRGLFVVVVALVALFFAVWALLPKHAHVERSVSTTADPATVYALVDGFTHFNEWSPWARLDPGTRYTYGGPERGVGARMEWASDQPEVGSGRQEVIAVEPGRSVTYDLDLGMGNPTLSTITLLPEPAGTRITWALDVDLSSSLLGRYFGLLLDRMVGPDYERGLARLRALAESGAPAASPKVTPQPPSPQ